MRGSVLILAGTAEARAVCAAVRDLEVLASLAGATARPAALGVPTRVGGFGGEAGFAAALAGMAAVLDATHPYAARISERASRLCASRGLPYLRLMRAGWPARRGWRVHADAEAAARALPPGARVFLSVGPGSLAPFLGRGLHLICRRIDPAPPRSGVTWVIGRPPFPVEAEAALFRAHGITDLVTKDSGGPAAKLDAAEALGIAVHVIARPPPPPGEETDDIDRAIAFVRAHAADRDPG
ncbi:precorrin-6A/cobalt-precorrin-6A reductase [Jannaschia seohaensis]|uniref:Precorrin-6A/cobalt-precorrin-6A reductase n=1 Tax=Jannaschia seohaensis TaxID=475081 RepID=A0A2Y9AM53_9RHOB|nr:precorrin-6A/cobalt-precorrin-6A reductase [Jannaschia seohaensis]PWJ20355.1 precorrin-6A/cobalt-precorrin-6A reductase [Jannaschia seohaensis]SSA44408.1 precorrin-6A/cobalt-precorrin-6A reductase [Jannaschia seohaensis]